MKKSNWQIAGIVLGFIVLLGVGIMIKNIFSIQKENYIALTAEQKDEDILYLYNILEEVYPFWHDVEQNGVNTDDVFTDFHERVQKTGSDRKFYERSAQFLSQFGGIGHLGIMSSTLYQTHVDTYKDNADTYNLWLDVLENEMTVNAYTSLSQLEENTPLSKDTTTSLIETKITDEHTAYIKIPSFQYQQIETDRTTILSFYNDIKNMDNLIIDIRGNGGGSGIYWQELIAKPNVRQDLLQTSYALFIDSEMFRPFVEAEIPFDNIKPISQLPNFPNTSYDYQSTYTHFVEVTEEYSVAQNPFKGKIWVLVDEAVYSSSENFAIFCKDTGFATLVGQTTNGDGGLMNPVFFSLPNSGLLCRFSYLYRINGDGSSNELYGTTPDIFVDTDQDALEVCLKKIELLG